MPTPFTPPTPPDPLFANPVLLVALASVCFFIPLTIALSGVYFGLYNGRKSSRTTNKGTWRIGQVLVLMLVALFMFLGVLGLGSTLLIYHNEPPRMPDNLFDQPTSNVP